MDLSASHSHAVSALTPDPLADLDALLHLEETYFDEGVARGKEDGGEAGRREGRAFGLAHGFERFAAMGRLHGRAVVWGSRLRAMEASERRKPTDSPPSQTKVGEDTIATRVGEDLATEPEDSSSETTHPPFLPDLFAAAENTRESNRSDPGGVAADVTVDEEHENFAQLLQDQRWQPIRHNPRLQKHMLILYGLTEPESLSCENQEDAVAEFDDRFKRAVAKAAIIAKIVGEEVDVETEDSGGDGAGHSMGGSESRRKRDVGIEDVDILKVRH